MSGIQDSLPLYLKVLLCVGFSCTAAIVLYVLDEPVDLIFVKSSVFALYLIFALGFVPIGFGIVQSLRQSGFGVFLLNCGEGLAFSMMITIITWQPFQSVKESLEAFGLFFVFSFFGAMVGRHLWQKNRAI